MYDQHSFPEDFASVFEGSSTQRSTIGCVIPAYNEEESIAAVIEGLLSQTRVPDVIHVVVNNTSDKTVSIASQYAGPHEITTELGEQFTEVFVHDIGKNPDKKVGALNYGYSLVEGYDYLLGVDGDTIADEHAVENLETEIISDSRIGGISAIYTIDNTPFKGLAILPDQRQRSQFAAFNCRTCCAAATWPCSAVSSRCSTHVREVMQQNHQSTPWVKDSEVEDSLLSLQIKSAGYLTKISPIARADVGGMTTLAGLDAQQVKWTYGAIELMWPGQRGDTKGQPFHPNLRIRWFENFGMLTNLFVRIAFLLLLAGSLSLGAFVFSPVWLIPIGVAVMLNLRMAMTMQSRTRKDILFALLIAPAEIYMWIRLSHFARAWARFLSKKKVDNWAMQAKAEKGGGSGHWVPLLVGIAVVVAIAVIWMMLGPVVQSTILWVGWPIVGRGHRSSDAHDAPSCFPAHTARRPESPERLRKGSRGWDHLWGGVIQGSHLGSRVLRGEPVPDAPHSLDESRLCGVVSELASKIRHVGLDRALVGIPDEVGRHVRLAAQHDRQIRLAAHPPLRLEKRGQQVELGAGELYFAAVDQHDPAVGVQAQVAVRQPVPLSGIAAVRDGDVIAARMPLLIAVVRVGVCDGDGVRRGRLDAANVRRRKARVLRDAQ